MISLLKNEGTEEPWTGLSPNVLHGVCYTGLPKYTTGEGASDRVVQIKGALGVLHGVALGVLHAGCYRCASFVVTP